MSKMKLRYCGQSNQVPVFYESQIAHDVTNHIGLVYVETKIDILGPIWSSSVCDEN